MRISEDVRRCVVFFGIETDRGIQYGGTGFLVGIVEQGLVVSYLVTCRHVAKALERHNDAGGFIIRLNTKCGGANNAPIEHIPWCYHQDVTVDIAISPFWLSQEIFDHIYFDIFNYSITTSEVCCGDPISIVGLFRLHAGLERNVPIVHSGNVATLPDPKEKVILRDRITNDLVHSDLYLVEAQTLDGLSGSPVFVHQFIDLPIAVNTPQGCYPKAFGVEKLLGLYTGSWDGEPGVILAADRNFRGGARVPVGIGTVVAVEKIIEIIQGDPVLKAERKKSIDRRDAERAATTDSALSEPAASDENPNHLEDFNRLVGAAARKRPRDDQP